jgi:hypothetical protein
MLADMAMKTEAARHPVYIAAARAERGEGKLGFISSASKCFASDVAMEMTTDAVQLFGGYGYTRDFPVERMMRDAKVTQYTRATTRSSASSWPTPCSTAKSPILVSVRRFLVSMIRPRPGRTTVDRQLRRSGRSGAQGPVRQAG